MFSRDLVAELNSFANDEWAVLRHGKQISEAWLAHQLHPYGIHTKTLWQGDRSAKGYVETDFHDIFRRYITKTQIDVIRAESNKESRLEVSPPPKPADPPATAAPTRRRPVPASEATKKSCCSPARHASTRPHSTPAPTSA